MNVKFRSLNCVLLAVICLAAAAPAQAKKPAARKPALQAEDERARSLFVKKRADAMRVVVKRITQDGLAPVDPSQSFTKGDQIKVEFISNFSGYVYLINVAPSGRKQVIYPMADGLGQIVQADQKYFFPPERDVIEFDENPGIEVLQVVMSRQRIPYLEAAIRDNNGYLAETASSAAAELADGKAGVSKENVTPVLPKTGKDGIRSREIILAAGRDKDPEGSVVAIDPEKSSGQLKQGEAAVFEIRLKHN